MRIGIHLQALRPGEIGGNETYVRQLVRLLPQLDPELRLVLLCAAHNADTFAAAPDVEVRLLQDHQFAALDAATLRELELDLWFCPLLVLEPPEPGIPAVVTIPDLQHLSHPQFFSQRVLDWRHRRYPASARRADAVLTYSEFSRREIVASFGVAPERVHAIHLDAAPSFSAATARDVSYLEQIRSRYDLPREFLYYPANNWPHKNHRVLLEALRDPQVDDSLQLVLSGALVDGGEPLDGAALGNGLRGRVRHLGHVPDEDVPGLYALARAMVFPSVFEGFGLPLIEAMRSGCAVLCSRLTALPEVAGDAALYFDPHDAGDVARAINAATPDVRRRLTEAGRERAPEFDWRRTAQATLDVLRRAARRPTARISAPAASPRISIVTPSLQQGRFIERTLESIWRQDYPNLEHWVIDGGSTDGTREILERYAQRFPGRFHYLSEPDGGQANAINKGIERARGDIVGWINSDDTYEAGAFAAVAEAFRQQPGADLLYGRADFISDTDERLWAYPTLPRFDWGRLAHECYVCQPTVFWRRSVTDAGHRVDESLDLALDYEFWIRLGRLFDFQFVDRHLANSRVYQETKTLSCRDRVFDESYRVVKRHYGWVPLSWAIGWAHYRRDGGDAFFNRARVTPMTYAWALASVLRQNWSSPRCWPSLARDLTPIITQAPRALWRAVAPTARRSIDLPADCLVAELGVEVTRETERSGTPVDLWWADRHLARIAVNGPGRYTWYAGLPHKEDGGPYRMVLESDLLRRRAAHPITPRPFPVAAADRWLEQHDTLRLPSGWQEVELSFMLPVESDEGITVRFRYRDRTIEEWTFARPGDYRRKLILPRWIDANGGGTELAFESSAAIPPDLRRGETRRLALRLHEIVDRTEGAPQVRR